MQVDSAADAPPKAVDFKEGMQVRLPDQGKGRRTALARPQGCNEFLFPVKCARG